MENEKVNVSTRWKADEFPAEKRVSRLLHCRIVCVCGTNHLMLTREFDESGGDGKYTYC